MCFLKVQSSATTQNTKRNGDKPCTVTAVKKKLCAIYSRKLTGFQSISVPHFVFFLQWQAISLTVIERVQIAAIILGSLFLIASISWLVWSSLSPSAKWQRQDLLFQICYGMYGFMDIVCIGKTQRLSCYFTGDCCKY